MEWYQAVLGFDADPFPPSPPYVFCILRKDDIEIFLQQLTGECRNRTYTACLDGGVWNVYIRMQGIHAHYDRLSKRDNMKIITPLHRQPYGQTEFVIQDPNGYTRWFLLKSSKQGHIMLGSN